MFVQRIRFVAEVAEGATIDARPIRIGRHALEKAQSHNMLRIGFPVYINLSPVLPAPLEISYSLGAIEKIGSKQAGDRIADISVFR